MRASILLGLLGVAAAGCGGETQSSGSGGASSGGATGGTAGTGATGGTAGTGASGGTAGSGGTSGSGASGGTAGSGGGDAGTCPVPSPAGCLTNGCPDGQWCDPTSGCASSYCECMGGAWNCTNDCAGGTCVGFDGGTPSCTDIAASIAKQTQIIGSCTAVVRLTYTTLTHLGHQFVCGKYAQTDEAKALAQATQDTGFGGKLISGPLPTDEWVFYDSPGDFGGVSAVSARTGLSVFGGGIVWMGKGKVVWPSSWLHDPLGQGCAPVPIPQARGFLLQGTSQPLPQLEVDKAVKKVWSTALPAGLAQWGYLFDVLVLSYPPMVGPFDPSSAEYVVLINSGWLE